ncbi:MAG: seryl-tRNA synthetase, partial [Actinomycetota bacterium]|nr:seryl-tRNA synthetase [Actinomycetota bacterium]
MIDPRRLRTDLDAVKSGLARRGIDPAEVDRLADLERRERELKSHGDDLRATVRTMSKQIGELHKTGNREEASGLAAQSRIVGDEAKQVTAEAAAAGDELRDALLRIPNIPSDDAPDGTGPEDNVEVRVVGYRPDAYGDHQRVPHWEIGAELGILDMERGAKLSGSMFPMYRGDGARLVRALCQYALD